jgi:hypothetical protein
VDSLTDISNRANAAVFPTRRKSRIDNIPDLSRTSLFPLFTPPVVIYAHAVYQKCLCACVRVSFYRQGINEKKHDTAL